MLKEVTFQKEITEKHIFCDICGKDTNRTGDLSLNRCIHCKKDLCEECMKFTIPKDWNHILCNDDYEKWLNGDITIFGKYEKEFRKLHNKEYNDKCKI